MRASGDQFGDGVGDCRVGVDVEDGEGVLALFNASFAQNDGDEVSA